MQDWKPVALGATLTILAIGVSWAFLSIVRAIRNKFMEYRMLKADVQRLKNAVHSTKAQITALEFRSVTANVPVVDTTPKSSESGVHVRVLIPPDLPLVSEDPSEASSWDDDDKDTALPLNMPRKP